MRKRHSHFLSLSHTCSFCRRNDTNSRRKNTRHTHSIHAHTHTNQQIDKTFSSVASSSLSFVVFVEISRKQHHKSYIYLMVCHFDMDIFSCSLVVNFFFFFFFRSVVLSVFIWARSNLFYLSDDFVPNKYENVINSCNDLNQSDCPLISYDIILFASFSVAFILSRYYFVVLQFQ